MYIVLTKVFSLVHTTVFLHFRSLRSRTFNFIKSNSLCLINLNNLDRKQDVRKFDAPLYRKSPVQFWSCHAKACLTQKDNPEEPPYEINPMNAREAQKTVQSLQGRKSQSGRVEIEKMCQEPWCGRREHRLSSPTPVFPHPHRVVAKLTGD
jgi:hypothetical protein